ncbi:MAG: O-antigen ligase family protein [Candidatus Erginobacter occultus]|nr:O-antigen ligase family protein [Candidatus Erginobacter occultus]
MAKRVKNSGGIRRCEIIVEWGAVFLVVFSPLAFGAVETWAWITVAAGCFLIAGTERYRRHLLARLPPLPEALPPTARRPVADYLLCGFGILFLLGPLVQLIPLPVSLVSAVSPRTARYWLLTGRVTSGSWTVFSLYPSRTAGELVRLTAYGAIFYALKGYRPAGGSRTSFAARLLTAVVATGFVVSVIGILQKYSWQGMIYWLRPIRFGNPFGPFVNRNHFAGYIIMVIPLALGLLLTRQPRPAGEAFRDRMVRSDPRRLLLGFMALVMAVSLFLSYSRSGILAGVLAFIFLIGVSRHFRLIDRRQALVIFGTSLVLVALTLAFFGTADLVARFETVGGGGAEVEYRWDIWRDTVRIYRDYPVLGIGLGGFERFYPYYKSFYRRKPFTHAENDYLQVAAEMGTWGLASLAGFFLTFFGSVIFWKPEKNPTVRPRKRPGGWPVSGRELVAGCSAGVLGLLLQSVLNFNFAIPANALLLAVLLALAAGRIFPGR